MTDDNNNSNCECYDVASEAMGELDWLRGYILELMEENPRAINAILEVLTEEINESVMPSLDRLIRDVENEGEDALFEYNTGCPAQEHKDLRS